MRNTLLLAAALLLIAAPAFSQAENSAGDNISHSDKVHHGNKTSGAGSNQSVTPSGGIVPPGANSSSNLRKQQAAIRRSRAYKPNRDANGTPSNADSSTIGTAAYPQPGR